MSGTVWSKFFWTDWANDPALRLCGLAAQGLWMRMLCIAAESDPRGYVTVNGRSLEVTDIARLAGVTEIECEPLLAELARNGVFSRDRKGTIYSRRMVRDAKSAKKSQENGRNGGNPTLLKQREIFSWDNPPDKGEDKPHKPYAINQEEEKKDVSTKPAGRRLSYPRDFDDFLKQYPTDRLMSKQEASKAWGRLSDDDRAMVMISLPAFRAYCEKDTTYRPVHACRYISQRRFEGFAKAAEDVAKQAVIYPGTPQWQAWVKYKTEKGERIALMETEAKAGRGYRVQSEWPPTKSSEPRAA